MILDRPNSGLPELGKSRNFFGTYSKAAYSAACARRLGRAYSRTLPMITLRWASSGASRTLRKFLIFRVIRAADESLDMFVLGENVALADHVEGDEIGGVSLRHTHEGRHFLIVQRLHDHRILQLRNFARTSHVAQEGEILQETRERAAAPHDRISIGLCGVD